VATPAQWINSECHAQKEIDNKNQILDQKNHYILQLEEALKQQRQQQFGTSSEKASPDQLGLFNEAEAIEAETAAEEATVTIQNHTRQKKPRVSIPADLPREDIIHDLPEEEKVCPHDGMTQKYCDALPLYRQSDIFNRLGIELDRSNLANWMIKCGELVQPLINLLQDQLRERSVVHMDETTLQVLKEPGKSPQSKSYLWLMASFIGKPITLFHYDPGRSQQVPIDLLGTTVNTLMVDGYEWYQKSCDTYEIKRLGCWAHARRKFMDAKKIQPKGKTGKADQALAFIQKLYLIEKQLKDDSPDQRYQVRQQQASPIIEQIKTWLNKSLLHVPPKTALGKALQYLHNQWERLIGYVDDGTYPIDNNLAENAIRPFAIGRKNWLFANSQAGAKASANLYSLIQTAKANGLNPYDYLKQVFAALPNAKCIEDVEKCLPWNLPQNATN